MELSHTHLLKSGWLQLSSAQLSSGNFMMKASHQLMHTQATSAPEKKSIMQAPTKRGSRSVSHEGGLTGAVCYYAVKLGGKKEWCRRQRSRVLAAAETQIFMLACLMTAAMMKYGGPVVSRVLSDSYQSSLSL